MIYCTTAAPARLADERDTARLRLEARTDVQRIRFSRPGSVAGVHKPSLRAPNDSRLSCERATARRSMRRGGCRATDAFDGSACATVRAAAALVGLPSRLGRRADNIARLSASGSC